MQLQNTKLVQLIYNIIERQSALYIYLCVYVCVYIYIYVYKRERERERERERDLTSLRLLHNTIELATGHLDISNCPSS